jgi:hypothetical protein
MSMGKPEIIAPLIRKFFNKNPMGASLKVAFLPQGPEKLQAHEKNNVFIC